MITRLGGNTFYYNNTRQVLIIKNDAGESKLAIDTAQLKLITLRKEYRQIEAGALQRKSINDYVQHMFVQFEFADGTTSVSICVYDATTKPPAAVNALERQLRQWQKLITKTRSHEHQYA